MPADLTGHRKRTKSGWYSASVAPETTPAQRKSVQGVGRNKHLHYDPKTGRKLPKEKKS